MSISFAKTLRKNDTGETHSHQAGIAIPKKNGALLDFFPTLDNNSEDNPDAWIICEDPEGTEWKMRYIWYNGKLHGRSTRNEYRITHTRKFMKSWNANSGDEVVFSSTTERNRYRIKVVKQNTLAPGNSGIPAVIKLVGWRRVF